MVATRGVVGSSWGAQLAFPSAVAAVPVLSHCFSLSIGMAPDFSSSESCETLRHCVLLPSSRSHFFLSREDGALLHFPWQKSENKKRIGSRSSNPLLLLRPNSLVKDRFDCPDTTGKPFCFVSHAFDRSPRSDKVHDLKKSTRLPLVKVSQLFRIADWISMTATRDLSSNQTFLLLMSPR